MSLADPTSNELGVLSAEVDDQHRPRIHAHDASVVRVDALHREAVGELALPDDMKPGEWRWLTAVDLEKLGYSR